MPLRCSTRHLYSVDGLTDSDSENYTNVLRIARALDSQDTRGEQAVDQIVFYLSGLGSEGTFASIAEGVTGARIASKLDDCYAFIASNWRPDDEVSRSSTGGVLRRADGLLGGQFGRQIFFFGFSRGAYTVRMVAGTPFSRSAEARRSGSLSSPASQR